MVKIIFDKEETQKNLRIALEGIAFDMQEALKDKLTQEHGKDTGELQSSIIARVTPDNVIEIEMIEHGKYVEFGTPPHMPPVDELIGWVSRKWGASNKENAERKAWLLAMAIKKRGTRPFPFIRTTFMQELVPIARENLHSAFK